MAFGDTQIGGTAFSGRALYDSGVFTGMAEDVSDIVTMLSPFETPVLMELGDAERPAYNTYHEWLEDSLNPNTFYNDATSVAATTASNTIALSTTYSSGEGRHLMVGSILRNPVSDEYLQVTGIVGDTLTVSRGFAGSTVAAIAGNVGLQLISEAAQEGSDVLDDISRSRTRSFNVCQIFKKDIIVSGTVQSVRHIGIDSETDHQIQQRTRENLRDLEKAIILSRINTPAGTNYVGSTTLTRTMKGLRQWVPTANTTTVSAINNAALTSVMQLAWDQGGSDIDLLICGKTVKKNVDMLNESSTYSRVVTDQMDSFHRRIITEYEGTFGRLRVLMSRWMPDSEGIVVARNRVKVVPLSSRSFAYEPVAKTGDATKGMIIGEYTLEVRNPEGMCRFTLS